MRAFLVATALLVTCCAEPLPAGEACDRRAAAYCARVEACSPHALAARWGDRFNCLQRERASCLQRLGAPGSRDTPSFEAGCALALPQQSCVGLFANVPVLACVAPPGGVDDGFHCVTDGQCQSGTCNLGASTVCGICGAPARAGEACDARSCARGLVCASSPAVCVALGLAGAACDAAHPCALGFSCVGAGTMPGGCQPAIAVEGGDCDPQAATAASCDVDRELVCDAATMKCVATVERPGLLDDGAACGPSRGASGASGPACTAPAKCVGGVCTLPDPARCN